MTLVGKREETEAPWIQFKKPVLHCMPVLNVNKIGKRAFRKLVDGYDALASQNLQPLPEADHDPTRAAIDEVIADLQNPKFLYPTLIPRSRTDHLSGHH